MENKLNTKLIEQAYEFHKSQNEDLANDVEFRMAIEEYLVEMTKKLCESYSGWVILNEDEEQNINTNLS